MPPPAPQRFVSGNTLAAKSTSYKAPFLRKVILDIHPASALPLQGTSVVHLDGVCFCLMVLRMRE